VVAITEEGREVMQNREQARLGAWEPKTTRAERRAARAESRPGPQRSALGAEASALREALRAWRLAKSEKLGIPPYVLFWDRTLDELCLKRPSTPEQLLSIWGIGEQKRRLFGEEILSLIRKTPPEV
jgi:ATP-dependent DNA helicase RecQ